MYPPVDGTRIILTDYIMLVFALLQAWQCQQQCRDSHRSNTTIITILLKTGCVTFIDKIV